MTTAVVIGGGISGLSAAYYLQKSSKFAKIILLEASSRVGGWLHTVKTEDNAYFELGPHSIRPVGPQGKNTLLLADQVELAEDLVGVTRSRPEAKNRYLYVNKNIHALPKATMKSFFTETPPFSKSLLMYLLKESVTKGEAKKDESIYDFISRRFGPDIAHYGVDALCRGIFAGDCRKLSLKSCFPLLYNMEKNHGGIVKSSLLSTITNRGASKAKPKVETCDLIRRATEERWVSYTFRKGCQQLPDRMLEVLDSKPDVEIHTNTPCSSLSFKDNKAEVIVNGEVIKADYVVSSIFAKHMGTLIENDNGLSGLSSDMKSIPGVDVVVVCLEYCAKDLVQPGFGHLLPSCEDGKVLGVIYDSCMFPELDAPDLKTTRLTVMMGGAWYEDLQKAVPSMSEAELGKFAEGQLSSQLHFNLEPTNVHVAKLKDCIPQYVIGHSDRVERIFGTIKDRELPLSLVGSSYRGVSVNDCIYNTLLEVQNVTGVTL